MTPVTCAVPLMLLYATNPPYMRTCGGSRDRYATEKLWNAYRAGAVPVYVGPAADLLREQWLPTHSWIDGSSFASHEALADYLRHLAANPEEYVTCAPRLRGPVFV